MRACPPPLAAATVAARPSRRNADVGSDLRMPAKPDGQDCERGLTFQTAHPSLAAPRRLGGPARVGPNFAARWALGPIASLPLESSRPTPPSNRRKQVLTIAPSEIQSDGGHQAAGRRLNSAFAQPAALVQQPLPEPARQRLQQAPAGGHLPLPAEARSTEPLLGPTASIKIRPLALEIPTYSTQSPMTPNRPGSAPHATPHRRTP